MCRRHASASAPCDRAYVPAAAPPGRCRCGQQEARGRDASLPTLAQGLSTFLSPLGAVQVEGGHENTRVRPQGRSQPAPASASIKVKPVMRPEVGERPWGAVPLALLGHSADIIKLDSRERTRSGDRKRAPVCHLWDWKEGGPGAGQEKEAEAHPAPGAVPPGGTSVT